MTEPSPLAERLFDAVGLLRRHSRRLVGAPLPDLRLSGAQLELVRAVRRNPGISVAEAAGLIGVAPNTVSTLVRQLVTAGVVVRSQDDVDRRVANLYLTESATARVLAWRDRRGQATTAALATLTAEEHDALERALPVIAKVAAALGEADLAARSTEPAS